MLEQLAAYFAWNLPKVHHAGLAGARNWHVVGRVDDIGFFRCDDQLVLQAVKEASAVSPLSSAGR
jgi:hypothetical protein